MWQWIKNWFVGKPAEPMAEAYMEYPDGTKQIVMKKRQSGTITFHLQEYVHYYGWLDITFNLDPKGEKASYATEDSIKTAIQQDKKLKESLKVISETVVEILNV